MMVVIKLFAMLRERAGRDSIEIELPDSACVDDAITAVRAGGWLDPRLPVVLAVNREYADGDLLLSEGDELALIPPVSGGSDQELIHARIRDGELSLDPLVEFVRDPRAGAVVSFSGVTREVPSLEYEGYAEMAERKLLQVAREAIANHGLCRAAVEHRLGAVALSEASVVIAVSAPHRAEAFAGAREIIDVLKREVPIWKREEGEWVAGSLPGGNSR